MRSPRLVWTLLFLVSAVAGSTVLAADPAALAGCPQTVGMAAVDDSGSLAGQLRTALSSGNLVFALVLVLLGGLLTALSPCVYPLIPITLSIFGARQATSHLRGFLLSATYVSGMVILYSTLGVSFAAMGVLAGSALQSNWVTVSVALFCIAMAASMFGAFEFVLPASLQTRLSQAGGSGFRGAFVMGLVAGIIAAPCTGPVLSFILTLIARDGDLTKGALLMVVYALGMGLPFLVLGAFSQVISRLPRSGRWMEGVKGVFGLMMLGAALYYLQLASPALAGLTAPVATRGVWLGPVLLLVGIALGALHLSFKESPLEHKVRKAGGLLTATVGLMVLLSWINSGPTAPTSSGEPEIAWVKIGNTPDAEARFDEALAAAKKQCKPVMIDFGAEWCVACKELDHKTYIDGAVRQEAARFVNVKVDATDESPPLENIQRRFGVVGLPTIVFIDGRGQQLGEPHITGFLAAPDYVSMMKRVR